MSELLTRLMQRIGLSKVPRYARESFGYRATVLNTSEFKRIEDIPRKQWEYEPYLSDITNILTEELKTSEGSMKLWPIQAAALAEICMQRGVFLPIGVGRGKALISLLACVVTKAERPLLFVPAALRDQSLRHVIPEMSKHWKLSSRLPVVGYSELSLAKNAKMLEQYKPDLIILDECHNCKNVKAGRTRRLARYLRQEPATSVIAMSGTVSKRSIRDFAHIIRWALKENAPVPSQWHELCEWADSIDEKIPDEQRVHPGALMGFCKEGENVRQGFQRRLTETPGVVASRDDELGVSLTIRKVDYEVPEKIRGLMSKCRNLWERPDGEILAEATDLYRHMRTLSLGFWYTFEEPPPRDWMDARREWKSYVRETLRDNRRGLDTELQVWNECRMNHGYSEINPEWVAWKAIKDTFKPKSIPVWEDSFALDFCKDWLHGNEDSIVWTEHRAFGQRLEYTSGCVYTYFGAGDSRILDTPATRIIASVQAHGEGKNLQRYSRNLFTAPSASGQTWEQTLGRTHREGQQADRVWCDVMMSTPEMKDAFAQARADAKYLEDTFGNRQKLNYADMVI